MLQPDNLSSANGALDAAAGSSTSVSFGYGGPGYYCVLLPDGIGYGCFFFISQSSYDDWGSVGYEPQSGPYETIQQCQVGCGGGIPAPVANIFRSLRRLPNLANVRAAAGRRGSSSSGPSGSTPSSSTPSHSTPSHSTPSVSSHSGPSISSIPSYPSHSSTPLPSTSSASEGSIGSSSSSSSSCALIRKIEEYCSTVRIRVTKPGAAVDFFYIYVLNQEDFATHHYGVQAPYWYVEDTFYPPPSTVTADEWLYEGAKELDDERTYYIFAEFYRGEGDEVVYVEHSCILRYTYNSDLCIPQDPLARTRPGSKGTGNPLGTCVPCLASGIEQSLAGFAQSIMNSF